MSNIILIGFMGCGKTTAGRLVAEKTGYKFIDTDKFIETKYNMTISEIFSAFGEAKFRDMETEALREVCSMAGYVISTGGGIVVREENAEIMKKSGRVFFINTPFEVIKERLKDDMTRPLLKDGFEKAKSLLDDRMEKYINAADVIIEKETSAEVLAEILNKRG